MRRVLWRLGVPIAAFVGGVVGFAPVFAIGLGVPIFVPAPLALGTSALLAALAAGWVGNIAPPAPQQRTRSRLLAILAASGIGVILAFPAGVALLFAVSWLFLSNPDPESRIPLVGAAYAVIFAILASATSFATWRYRAPRVGRLGFEGVAGLALSVVRLVVLFWLVLVMGSGGTQAWPVQTGLGVTLALGALGDALAAWRSRRGTEGHDLGWDAALTLALVGLWTAVVIGTVHLTCRFVFLICRP